jgi:hypothetical protein
MCLPDVREHIHDMSWMDSIRLPLAAPSATDTTEAALPHARLLLPALRRGSLLVDVAEVKAIEFAYLRAIACDRGGTGPKFAGD